LKKKQVGQCHDTIKSLPSIVQPWPVDEGRHNSRVVVNRQIVA